MTVLYIYIYMCVCVCVCVCVMDSCVDFNIWGPNRSVKDMNHWTIYSGDLFIGVRVCLMPAMLLGISWWQKNNALLCHRFSWTIQFRNHWLSKVLANQLYRWFVNSGGGWNIELVILFGWADNGRKAHQCVTDSTEQLSSGFEFKVFLSPSPVAFQS